MRRKQRPEVYTGAQRAGTKQHSIPHEYEKWTKGRTVDLSQSSEYYKKQWNIYRVLVPTQVQSVGENSYELQPAFFESFISSLTDLVRDKVFRNIGHVNLVAEALCYAAYLAAPNEDAVTGSLRFVPMGPPGPLVLHEEDPLNFVDRLSRAPTVAEEWQGLDNSPVPILEPITLSKTASKWEPGYLDDCPVVNLIPEYNHDKRKHPRFTIEIEGAPVCLLMKASQNNHPTRESNLDFDEAEGLWKALQHWMSVSVGFAHEKGGRPSLDQGRRAAFLHEHLGMSWSLVARKLCRERYTDPRHNHDKDCSENFRKQAEQYWKRLRKQVQTRLASS